MDVWFLVVLFLNNPNARVAVYPTEKDCKKFMPIAIQEFKDNKDVKSISCMAGKVEENKEEKKSEDILI